MDIRDIEYFLELSRQKSFTRTANKFFVTQSALSQKIHGLETELGVKLFNRSHRTVSLTQAGRVMYEYADNIMHDWNKMLAAMKKFRDDEQTNISIGLFMQAAYSDLPSMVTDFISMYNDYCVNISVTSEANLLKGIKNNTFDFAFLRCNPSFLPPEVDYIPLYNDSVNVLLHKDDPLSKKRAVTLSDIVGYKLICEKEEFDNSYVSLKKNFSEQGLSLPMPYAYTDQAYMLPILISSSGFYAFTTAQSGPGIEEKFPHLCSRELDPVVPITANLLFSGENQEFRTHSFSTYIQHSCRERYSDLLEFH